MDISTPTILYEKKDQVAYITLNRPDVLNALNQELRGGLREALVDFRDDPDMLVAIMTGAGGRAFSAGMDLKDRARGDAAGEQRPGAHVEAPVDRPRQLPRDRRRPFHAAPRRGVQPLRRRGLVGLRDEQHGQRPAVASRPLT